MATPSVSINVTSVDENEKKIYYTVSYSADYEPEAKEENYHKGETGYRYVNKQLSESFKSYQNEYDNGDSSITFTVTYMWECRAIKREETGVTGVGNFSTEAEAQEYINNQPYPEDYTITRPTPIVWSVFKKTYKYSVYTSGNLQQDSASATAYFRPKPSTPSTPSPSFSISYTDTTVTANISNLIPEQKVIFQVLQTFSTAGGIVVGSEEDTATESSMSLTVSGLTANTEYTARVSVAGTYLKDESFITLSASSSPTCETSFNNNQITVTISNISVGETAWLYIRESDDITGSLPSYTKESYTRISSTDSSSVTWTKTVEYDISYTYSVVIQPNNIYLVDGEMFTLTLGEEFNWITDIQQWKKMEIWQHPASGYMLPAPVTAEEWNRLVKIVNTKCGTDIDDVSIGEPMRAGPGGNVRQVADALGVKVDKGDRITAEFFLKLQDAVNNIK